MKKVAEKLKILYLIDYFHRTGGTERHLAHLVLNLPKDRFEFAIAVFDLGKNPLIDEIRDSGVSVIDVPVGREYTPNALIQAVKLFRFIRSNNFDIVQTFHQKSDSFGAVIAKLAGVRHIISSKRDIGQLKKRWHFFINRRCRGLFDKIIVVADAVGEVVIQNERIDRSRIVKIYNGVDETEFKPAEKEKIRQARVHKGYADNDFVVGMVAGFRPEKAYDVFFDGLSRALGSIPNLKIVAVGGGPLLEFFRNKIGANSLGSKTLFAGAVGNVKDYLKVMDVGCLIPRGNEGFSNSILEKMAMGLPLIVSDVGGNSEAIIDRENGLVIPPDNIDAFKAALIEIHSDSKMRIKMGKLSRQLIEDKFTLQQMCNAHEKLYFSIIDRP